MHLAGAGVKAWPLLTSPLAGVPMVTQEGLTARPHEKSHPNPGYPGREAWGQPCKGCAAHCTKGETESHDKKKGVFPQGTQPGPRSPEAFQLHSHLLSFLPSAFRPQIHNFLGKSS